MPIRSHAFIAGAVPALLLACAATGGSIRAASTGNPALDEALDAAVAQSLFPDAARRAILRRIEHSPACWPEGLNANDIQRLFRDLDLLPPTQFIPFDPDERFVTDSAVWTGDVVIGVSNRAQRANLTYSFAADGVTWGLSAVSATGPNTLNASLTNLFGANDLDEGREYIRQALASWRRYGGLTYTEVADNGEAMNQSTTRSALRGDIRIGGRAFGTGGFLAYNAFPSASGLAGVGGGDMCINTSYFTGAAFNQSANSYRYFRNTVAHEHGHGLGNVHTVPCNSTKLMEPSIQTSTDAVTIDERRGAGRSYGDRYSGNNSAANATNFGDLTSPAVRSVIERNLSTNGTAGFNNTDEDWFRFTLSSTQNVVVTVDPTGGTYTNGQQSSNCSGSTSSIVADQAGNLNIELRSSDGTSVLLTAASAAAGANEVLTANNLAPGEYTLRVFDVGPNANQTVQLYDLTVRVGSSLAPPQAIAGLHKRIAANTNCFFMGDVNSAAMDAGATLNAASFDWDLNGDGVFEVNDVTKPMRQYVSNGVYPVTLRVTDSLGSSGFDTINLTVFGAVTDLASITPNSGDQNTQVAITLTGVNLKNVVPSDVSVSGTGVAVIGVSTPDAEGTSVSGLILDIAPDAPVGARNITVSNADGSDTLVAAFEVLLGVAPCPGDLDGNQSIDFSDLNLLLGNFGQFGPGLLGDLDNDNDVDFADLNALLSVYQTPCP
ncbi:MAG: pre-peptidase C-terminal domain-containing protein [Phycisphaerales bacterium]|nr:pre-peptidase C-terminal domain-containing protein [Phycisphaerales bacterium]